MTKALAKASRGPMIHIRLDEKTHRDLIVLVARTDTTIQQVVESMICRRVGHAKTESTGE